MIFSPKSYSTQVLTCFAWARAGNEIKQNYGDFLTRWRSEPTELQVPRAERLADVAQRAWLGLNQIAARHETSDTIVVVSHNFPIVGIVCRITGTRLNDYRNFHLDPCGVSRLHRNGTVPGK